MSDCLFCKIIASEIPATVIDAGELVMLADINPQAPLHMLIIPKRHISTLNDLTSDDDQLVGSMFRLAASTAQKHGYGERGYRTVFNCNREAGQSVFHIHLHLLAGRGLNWPPG